MAVVGAGVFGSWTAYQLRASGLKVVVLDAYGAANSRASSGGESRIIRMGYGLDALYSRMAQRALRLWQAFFRQIGQALFHRTGVLWLASEDDRYTVQSLHTLQKLRIKSEMLPLVELKRRYPQLGLDGVNWGLLEPQSGTLMARRAVQEVLQQAIKDGVTYVSAAAEPPTGEGHLKSLRLLGSGTVSADTYVFACGPWLPRVFPALLADRIFPTRQDVFFFGVPAGSRQFAPPALPTWLHHGDQAYGMPDLERRGLKIAIDRHGPHFDPETGSRVVSLEELASVQKYLARRFPGMKGAPMVEARVCQYENTSSGDFLIDRHPGFENVWIVGGGSGHGFKHGPVVGEYVRDRIFGECTPEPRFSLQHKATVQARSVY